MADAPNLLNTTFYERSITIFSDQIQRCLGGGQGGSGGMEVRLTHQGSFKSYLNLVKNVMICGGWSIRLNTS